MRYHYERPDVYTTMCGETYIRDHPVYDRCTLFRIGGKGLAVMQQRFDPRDEGDEMDGDRPVADGRDIFESKLQSIVREAFVDGWSNSHRPIPLLRDEIVRYDKRVHELLISCLDSPTGDAGAQDEASEAREMETVFDRKDI